MCCLQQKASGDWGRQGVRLGAGVRVRASVHLWKLGSVFYSTVVGVWVRVGVTLWDLG